MDLQLLMGFELVTKIPFACAEFSDSQLLFVMAKVFCNFALCLELMVIPMMSFISLVFYLVMHSVRNEKAGFYKLSWPN